MKFAPRAAAFVLLSSLAAGLLASCGDLLDQVDKATTFNVPVEFDIDQTISVPLDLLESVPEGPHPPLTINIPPIYAGNTSLSEYSDKFSSATGVVEAVTVTAITSNFRSNSLDIGLEPIQIYFGQEGGVGSDDYIRDSVLVATTGEYGPGETGAKPATLDVANAGALTQTLRTGRFGIGLKTAAKVPANVTPAGGEADATFTIKLNIRISPL